MNVIEGGQVNQEEVQKVRDRVVATVEERWKAGELKEQLPLGEIGWQGYLQKMVQERQMGEPPEVEAWAEEGRYKVTAYREAKGGWQGDKGVWRGERQKGRNPVDEGEGVRGDVG